MNENFYSANNKIINFGHQQYSYDATSDASLKNTIAVFNTRN